MTENRGEKSLRNEGNAEKFSKFPKCEEIALKKILRLRREKITRKALSSVWVSRGHGKYLSLLAVRIQDQLGVQGRKVKI